MDHTLSDDEARQLVGFDVLDWLNNSGLPSRAEREMFAAWILASTFAP
ncbi:hypothetical protein AAFP30_10095 [Gordonia sp. CPCC 205515]